MKLALAFFLGAASACFFLRSGVGDFDWRTKYILRNYGLVFLLFALSIAIGIFAHAQGWVTED